LDVEIYWSRSEMDDNGDDAGAAKLVYREARDIGY
jgi:hypothetical protein